MRVQDGKLIEIGVSRNTVQSSSFQHAGGGYHGGKDGRQIDLPYADKQDSLELFCMWHAASFLSVTEGAEKIVLLRHDYGLLGVVNPGPSEASFLTARGNVVFEAGE